MNVKIKRSTVTLLLMSCCLLNHTSVTYADGFIGAVKTVGAVENALGVEKHDTETVQAMLDVGVDINGVYGTNKQGTTALQIALKAYDLDMMQFLLERGADVNGYYRLDGKYVSYLVRHLEDQYINITINKKAPLLRRCFFIYCYVRLKMQAQPRLCTSPE